MRLVGEPGLARRFDRGHASRQQLDRPFGSSDLPDDPSGQPRRPRRPAVPPSAWTDLRPLLARLPTPPHRAPAARRERACRRRRRRCPVLELPCRPVEPERRARRLRQRQRSVDKLARPQCRHEGAEAELDAEELGILRYRHGRCLRLRPSHRQKRRAPLPRDDHLPMGRGHRDERLLRFTSCRPGLVDERRPRRSSVECEQLDGAFHEYFDRAAVCELIARLRRLVEGN